MPEEQAPPSQPSNPAAPSGGKPGQPPFGSSPATGPTQNRGYEAAALKRMGLILDAIAETVPLVGASTEAGQALTDAMRKLAKFVPPGAVTPADKQNAMRQQMLKQQQTGAMMGKLQSGAAQPGAAGGAPQPPAAKAA